MVMSISLSVTDVGAGSGVGVVAPGGVMLVKPSRRTTGGPPAVKPCPRIRRFADCPTLTACGMQGFFGSVRLHDVEGASDPSGGCATGTPYAGTLSASSKA